MRVSYTFACYQNQCDATRMFHRKEKNKVCYKPQQSKAKENISFILNNFLWQVKTINVGIEEHRRVAMPMLIVMHNNHCDFSYYWLLIHTLLPQSMNEKVRPLLFVIISKILGSDYKLRREEENFPSNENVMRLIILGQRVVL